MKIKIFPWTHVEGKNKKLTCQFFFFFVFVFFFVGHEFSSTSEYLVDRVTYSRCPYLKDNVCTYCRDQSVCNKLFDVHLPVVVQ